MILMRPYPPVHVVNLDDVDVDNFFHTFNSQMRTMVLVCLPTFTLKIIKHHPSVGKYTIHGAYGIGNESTNGP